MAFVQENGIVLESAQGPAPNLAAKVAAEDLRGSWWAHKKAREIFTITRAVRNSEDVLVCRLIDGKVTYVHRRLWPALVRMAGKIPKIQLAAIREIHLENGKHKVEETPFPYWVPVEVQGQAADLSEDEATAMLGSFLPAVLGWS